MRRVNSKESRGVEDLIKGPLMIPTKRRLLTPKRTPPRNTSPECSLQVIHVGRDKEISKFLVTNLMITIRDSFLLDELEGC